jgi:thiamine biosynthesis lipoprotein
MRWNNSTVAILILVYAAVSYTQVSPELTRTHKQRYAMGTVFEIVTYDTRDGEASAAIDRAFEEILRLDGVMSNYKRDSELSRLNRNAHFHSVAVSADLYRIIGQSVQYSRLSGGEFDVTVGPLVDLWKAQQRGEHVVTANDEKKARECLGFQKIELLPPDHIAFRSSCLRIDLGGIGKGYAVDRAVEVLRAASIERALINAGGSTIYAIGTPPGEAGWTVKLRDLSGRVRPEVVLKDNSVSTSEQSPPNLLGKYSGGHIIDPRQGKPLQSSRSVSVVARTATASDALSTTMLIVGADRGKALLATIAGTAAVWISPDGEWDRASNGATISQTVAVDEVRDRSYR